jgi:4-amino-4-deoxy-L-arabinose transferase-like glycosyltransferase
VNQSLILAMSALQLVWLAGITITRASTKYDTILSVAIFSITATVGVMVLPGGVLQGQKYLRDWLFLSEKRWLFILCLAGLLIGILYASSQHLWGDEKTSLKAANIISTQGVPEAYEDVGWLREQHPPLFSIIFALALELPGPDLFFMRLVSVFFLVGTLVVTYFLGRELYNREVGCLASLLMLSFPLVTRLGASAMMDIQLAFFFGFGLLLFVCLSSKPSFGLACAAGLVIGLGLLTKYMMALIFVVLFFYFIFVQRFRKITSYLLIVMALAMSVFAIWLFYANHLGLLSVQFEKILNFVGSYHVVRNLGEQAPSIPPMTEDESADPKDLMENGIFRLGLESLFTRIPSSLGVYHAPLLIFGLLYLLKKRKPADLILLLWISAVSISLFLTLPDHRYFLPVFPALAIALAQVLLRFPGYVKQVTFLSLLFAAGNLYLFANWVREAHLFLLMP